MGSANVPHHDVLFEQLIPKEVALDKIKLGRGYRFSDASSPSTDKQGVKCTYDKCGLNRYDEDHWWKKLQSCDHRRQRTGRPRPPRLTRMIKATRRRSPQPWPIDRRICTRVEKPQISSLRISRLPEVPQKGKHSLEDFCLRCTIRARTTMCERKETNKHHGLSNSSSSIQTSDPPFHAR
jgi:hypothetical protein